jgi:deoxyhypusine synthase
MKKKYSPLDFEKASTYSLKERPSKVRIDSLGRPFTKGTMSEFLSTLPCHLGARDLIEVADLVAQSVKNNRPVILGMGAHPIKVGLSPLIIDLLERNILSALALNGAGIIHDFELAFGGHTSEDVAHNLSDGSFGMAEETGLMINQAINNGVKQGLGIGESMGKFIEESDFPYKKLSLFAAAYRLEIPATVHIAVGADIIHMHPHADGASIGEGSLRDFKLLAAVVSELDSGVYLNVGSAVILPEVFLKALNIARNLGKKVSPITTVNMDFIQHYRPRENIVKRPTMDGGKGYTLTGHHEIMFPLLASAIKDKLEEQ